eukprot:CAMPEP_0202901132 /NCGR_PEP_ID=MMETSP1392-20130828/13462_1 /ASSEMBLY_ACC=CAM_ASM_000868 /TAXON_ID=225041 /ORGANISM="Chlamydomonas chlamydogama, Strain SAG 11-48b" /LENGTH=176 /DNA_ID=CAMNT_0049587641 /DNA_START=765 /DNA_END=1295 /DNA_ORIENTATION=-
MVQRSPGRPSCCSHAAASGPEHTCLHSFALVAALRGVPQLRIQHRELRPSRWIYDAELAAVNVEVVDAAALVVVAGPGSSSVVDRFVRGADPEGVGPGANTGECVEVEGGGGGSLPVGQQQGGGWGGEGWEVGVGADTNITSDVDSSDSGRQVGQQPLGGLAAWQGAHHQSRQQRH